MEPKQVLSNESSLQSIREQSSNFQDMKMLNLPMHMPVWYSILVEAGQKLGVEALIEYVDFDEYDGRQAVMIIKAFDESGSILDIAFNGLYWSKPFNSYFKYLQDTENEVHELYKLIVPEGVHTIKFGFSRFKCLESQQVRLSKLAIGAELIEKQSSDLQSVIFDSIKKLELPLQEPIWYHLSVKDGQSISIEAEVEYLNIESTENRKAVILVRGYDKSGEEIDVSFENTFNSKKFAARFKYLSSTKGESKELYTLIVPKGIHTISLGFSRFQCKEEEEVLLHNINVYAETVVYVNNRNDFFELQDEYKKSYENLYKLKSKMINELETNIKEIELILDLNRDLKALFSNSDINVIQSDSEKTKILKSTEINVSKRHKSELKDTFEQGLTLLDPISEECWSDAFKGFGMVKDSYANQINTTKSDFAFFESAWKANKSQWLYAFNSPNLQHDNAQKLLDVIGKLRSKSVPVIFWNKEDPMHYNMFKPIAKEADYIFTTDSLIVERYKKDLNNKNVWALSFAAPVRKTNPINRFSENIENVCFAGTYYAKNHPDRKKQMDQLLPALLENNGFIYNRVSENKSDNYAYPSEYNEIIRDGVGFEEMIELYKKFKVFLNVNTIVNSPTMMSRRVYELLASGTPVVSTPSKAITAQFPGIVLTATNKEEANIAVGNLLGNSYFWHRQSVLGIREIMLNHTYQIRWEYIKNCIKDKEANDDSLNEVSVVAKYTGLIEIEGYIETLLNQNNIKLNKLILINSSKNLSKKLVEKISESDENAKVLIVDSYNDAINELKKVSSYYVYFTEDSIINFQNAVLDLILAKKYTKSKAIKRQVYYGFEELKDKSVDKVDLNINNANWYKTIDDTSLRSVLIDRAYLDMYTINPSKWEIESTIDDNNIFIIDPFNIVFIKNSKNNTVLNYKTVSNFIYKYNSWLGI